MTHKGRTPPSLPDEAGTIQDYMRYLVHGPPLMLALDGHHAWLTMQLVQKMIPVPSFPRTLAIAVEPIARKLQPELARTPLLAQLAEAGWQPSPHAESSTEATPEFVADYGQFILYGPHVEVELGGHQAWSLFCTLQLAARKFPMPPGIRDQVMHLARGLQQQVARSPRLATLAESGWDPRFDTQTQSAILDLPTPSA